MVRLGNTATWLLAGTIFLVTVVWTNLTGLGLGTNPLTYDDVALPRFAVTIVGATGVWVLLAIMASRGFKLAWDPTWALLGALAVWSGVSGAFAGSTLVWLGQSERLEGVATVVLYALLYSAGLQLGGSKRSSRMLSAALVLGAVLLGFHGLLQVAKLDPTNYMVSGYSFYLGSAFASLGNPNFLAGVLVLALPIAVVFGLTASERIIRYAWWAGGAVILAALYATYSQGAWLAVLVEAALGVTLWLWGRQASTRDADAAPRRSMLRAAGPALLIFVVGVAVIVAVTGIATQRGLRLWGASLSETGSGRIFLAQTTVNAMADRPLFGFGPDNYLAAFRLHRPPRYAEVFGEASQSGNAHSWIGQYAATLGVPGALLLAAALVYGLVRSRPRWGTQGEDSPRLLATAIWIGAIGFLVQMMLNVAVLASTVPFWVLLGVISAPHARRVHISRAAGRVAVTACTLLLLGAVIGSGLLLAADAAFLSSRLAYNADAAGDPVALAEKAATLNPLSVKYSRAIAQSRSSLVFDAIMQGNMPDRDVRALYVDARAAFDDTLSLSPNDYAALSWLAGLQAATGTHLEAPALLAEARKSAQRAAAVDVTHASVVPLLEGKTSDSAARSAILVPGLP